MKNKKYKPNNNINLIIIVMIILATITICFSIFTDFEPKEFKIELNSNYNELFSEQEMKENGNISLLPEYNADAAVAYKNKDGKTHLYVYAAPIRYKNKSFKMKMIDTRIKNVEDESFRKNGYFYTVADNDIFPLYPKALDKNHGIKLVHNISYQINFNTNKPIYAKYAKNENFIGEIKNMITYKNVLSDKIDLRFYPSLIGTNCEIYFAQDTDSNIFNFWIDLENKDLIMSKTLGGYLIIYDNEPNMIDGAVEKNILGIIQPPILKDNFGNISVNNKISYEKEENGKYLIKIKFENKIINKDSIAFLSMEMRRPKQPDNAIYSGKPDITHSYLSNYAVIGKSPEYDTGKQFIRFLFCDLFAIQPHEIESAKYYIYNLGENFYQKNESIFKLNTIDERWCSILDNWNSNITIGNQITQSTTKNHILEFNIKNEVQDWCNNKSPKKEEYGLLLSALEEENFNILLSNDNTLYKNRTEIVLNR